MFSKAAALTAACLCVLLSSSLAEAQTVTLTASDALDTFSVFVTLDGLQMDPQGSVVYCAGHSPLETASFTWFKDNVAAGLHTVRAQVTWSDVTTTDALSADFCPWTLLLEVAN